MWKSGIELTYVALCCPTLYVVSILCRFKTLDLGMTAGKVQTTGALPPDATSGTSEQEKLQGNEIPSTKPAAETSASDGPGITHGKFRHCRNLNPVFYIVKKA